MRFRTTVELGGKTATGMEVPADVVEALASGKKPRVLSAENREAAGVKAGEEVDVDVELDTAPRVVEVPDDLGNALDAEPAAKAAWERLSYSHQRQHVLAIDEAKAAETRQRRIEKCVAMLRE